MQINKKNMLEDSNESILTFNQLVNRYISYWPLYLLLMLFAFGAASVYLKLANPKYLTTARLLVKDQRKGAEDSKAMENLNLISTKKIIENELEIVQSNTLITNVVNELGLYAPIHEKKKFRKVDAYTTSPIKIEAEFPDSIAMKSGPVENIFFDYNKKERRVVIKGQSYPLREWVSTPYGKLRFVENKYNLEGNQNGNLYFNLINPKIIASAIKENLEVATASKPSTILNIDLKDEVPQRGEDILNALLATYGKATIDDKNELASNTLIFFDLRLKLISHELDSIENKVQMYKNSKDAVNLSERGNLFLKNISDNDQKLSDFRMRLAALEQTEKYVLDKNDAQGIAPSSLGFTDLNLQNLLSKLYETEMQYEKMKKTTAENNPNMVSLRDQMERIRPIILENVRNQRKNLEASRDDLLATNSKYSNDLNALPKKERELVDMVREETIRTDIYVYLLRKREEAALSYSSTVSDSRVVDKAQSAIIPYSPKKLIIYPAAMLVAFVLGIAFVTLRETFNQKILHRSEIEKMTIQPVIGEIAKTKENTLLAINNNKKSLISEQFRKLRVSLNYIGLNGKHKKLLVTSTIPGEGKSFVAANLGMSLASTGKKVILVNFDLHSAELDSYLELKDQKFGLAQFLSGEIEAKELVKTTEFSNNLYVVNAGILPENPSELIMNGKIKSLLDYLDAHFDVIIIDTPPVGVLTDAYIVGEYCDATLFVIRQGITPKVAVARIDENNKISHLKNIGIVFNSIQQRGFGNKNYASTYQYPIQVPNKKDDLKKKLSINKFFGLS